ncbi:hypothetical protein ACFLSS_02530 [Bacteroidota bacterium]
MKKLVFTFFAAVIIFMLPVNSLCQERDSLIQLYTGIGDTIDVFEREYFGLFLNIDDFVQAQLYIRDNSLLVSKVTYASDGILKDTISVQQLSALDNVRLKINKIEKEDDEKLEILPGVKILTKDGNIHEGQLVMFNKYYLYLLSGESTGSGFKIPLSNINNVVLLGESEVLSSMGGGALWGGVIGAIIGFISGDDESGFLKFTAGEKAIGGGLIFGFIGGIIGLISGLGSSTDDETIQINSQQDAIKLRDYAKYYFIYDEEVENSYAETK